MPRTFDLAIFDMLVVPGSHEGPPGDGAGGLAYLFKGVRDRAAFIRKPADLVAEMDANGITRSLLSIQSDGDRPWVADACAEYPDRFVPGLGVDPRNGMSEIRRIDSYVAEVGVRLLRLGPWRIQKPPTDRVYWPVYVKAIELGLPVEINVGIPGPKVPGWTQDPIYVDEVCYEFPELKVVMTHVGYPWVGTVVRNLIRWDNCYLVMNSFAPKFWPQEIVDYMRSRGRQKVMYGTEYPLMTWDRSLREIANHNFDQSLLQAFLYDNAASLFSA